MTHWAKQMYFYTKDFGSIIIVYYKILKLIFNCIGYAK